MKRALRLTLALSVILTAAALPAQAQGQTGFVNAVYKDSNGVEAKYVVFVPHDYKGDKPYPLILYLHGAGESGTDGEKPVKVGLGPAIKKQEKTFPFIVVFPQSQKRTWQADGPDAERALAILAQVQAQYRVNRQRITLTGVSMGGFGVWSLAARHPEKWSAIVPICGGGNPTDAVKFKDVPCWCFHGAADPTVSAEKSRAMIKALKDAGATSAILTEYIAVGHNCWDRAYGTAELWAWLARERKS